jgi:O-antigen ligase
MAVGYDPLIGRSLNLVLTRGVDFDTVRIDPPVLRLMCVTVLLATFAKVPREGPLARVRWIAVAIMLAVEAFSLTRTTWTPMLAAWLVLPLLTWGWAGVTSAVRRGAAMAVALIVLLGVASAGTVGPTAQAMAVRAASVTDSGLTKDPSLQDRLLENEAAWAQIKEHPLGGIGFPRAYGAYQYSYDVETDFTENIPKHFIHQTYLGIWLWFGVPGLVAFLTLIAYIVRAIARIRSMRYRDLTVPMTIVAGLGALGFSSAFQTNLIYRPAYFAVAASLACLDVWIGDRNMPRDHVVRETDRARPKASGVVRAD